MPIIRATFSGLLFGNTWNNVVHFNYATGAYTYSSFANILDTLWVDRFRAWQHNGISWLDIEIREVGVTPPPAVFHKTISKVGSAVGAGNADQVLLAIVVKLLTAQSGPKGRGRFFIGGVSIGTSTNLGLLTPATIVAFNPTLTMIMSEFGAGGSTGAQVGVTSRTNPITDFKTVTAMQLRNTLGTVRSRQYGVGS